MLQRTHPADEVETGSDAGLGLVEVLVAMLVFAIVAVSVAYSVTFTLSTTKDSKARQIALNLAASEIDAVRAVGDPFDVYSATRTETRGETYTIERLASWVSESGSDAVCSASGGTLRYKRVNVTVTWNGMGRTAAAARADTLLAPATRINDPAKGTIFVSVLGADGRGLPGIQPTITGPGSPVAPPTDADGCSYVLGVTPGNYAVSLSKTGYLDTTQTSPSRVPAVSGTIAVLAGQSTAYQFQYDNAGTFPTQYATNRSAIAAGTTTAIIFPPGLITNFVSTLGLHTRTAVPVESGSNPRVAQLSPSTNLFPVPGGYQAFAGEYVAAVPGNDGCQVADPVAWGTDPTTGAVGQRGAGQSTAPGGSATAIRVPMGIMQAARPAATNRNFLVAVRQTTPVLEGQPTCTGSATEIRFGQVFTSNNAIRIALPFGSWKLYATRQNGTSITVSADVTQLTTAAHASVLSNVTPGRDIATTGGVFTLDPRGITP